MDNLPRFIVIAFTFIKPAWLFIFPPRSFYPFLLFSPSLSLVGWLRPEASALFFILAMALAFHSSSAHLAWAVQPGSSSLPEKMVN